MKPLLCGLFVMNYLTIPFLFLKFWYFEAPREIYGYCISLNKAFLQLFSMPLMLQTFFKPLKNEYRPGLVKFSRAMGIIIKSCLLFADALLFGLLICAEITVFISFVSFPLLTIAMLFL